MAHFFLSRKKFETAVSKQAAEVCEHIVTEMGAELHDDLIQKLSVFRLYLDRLERAIQNPEETERLLMNMRADFESVTLSVRRISRRLLQVRMEDDSFQTGIGLLCQNMAGNGAGNIHFEHSGAEQPIPQLIHDDGIGQVFLLHGPSRKQNGFGRLSHCFWKLWKAWKTIDLQQ